MSLEKRRPEENKIHPFSLIALRKGSSDLLLSSHGSGEAARDAPNLAVGMGNHWDPQPGPLKGVMDAREGEEEEAVS